MFFVNHNLFPHYWWRRLNLTHQCRDAGTQIYQKVRSLEERAHKLEKCLIILVVACLHQTHIIQVSRENISIFVDSSVLDDIVAALAYLHHLTETAVKEIYLQVERPALHIFIKTLQIRIVVDLLEMRLPSEML